MKALKQVLNFSHFSQLYLELGICSTASLDWATIPQSLADLYVCHLDQWTVCAFVIAKDSKYKFSYFTHELLSRFPERGHIFCTVYHVTERMAFLKTLLVLWPLSPQAAKALVCYSLSVCRERRYWCTFSIIQILPIIFLACWSLHHLFTPILITSDLPVFQKTS